MYYYIFRDKKDIIYLDDSLIFCRAPENPLTPYIWYIFAKLSSYFIGWQATDLHYFNQQQPSFISLSGSVRDLTKRNCVGCQGLTQPSFTRAWTGYV